MLIDIAVFGDKVSFACVYCICMTVYACLADSEAGERSVIITRTSGSLLWR